MMKVKTIFHYILIEIKMDTIILQCKIIQSSLLSCNLPLFAYNRYQSLLSSTSTSSSYVVFQLINDDNIYHYIVWTGDISNGTYQSFKNIQPLLL